MDKQQARDIVRDTLGNLFAKEAFTRLVKELFNQIDESKAFHARGYVPESYKKYVKTYERLATYTDPNDLKIDILIVYLQSETTLERARTSQRNFIAHYLKERGQKDAGLVAFVSPNPSDWRFSLVKMDYRFEEGKDGKVKVKEEFTPARRWSFLVGANENSHTAQSRLAPRIADDTHNPTLAELEEAFNIETVTKEFFTEYRNLFLRVKEALDVIVAKDATIKSNFEQNGVNTVDFAKKLLGQIVFLYFLQKKGWFGVARDAAWGTGSKQFLRELFEGNHGQYNNFFNDILEPLFYDALSRDRSDIDHWNDQFKCKIPFLNGGLFDPINGYDWVKTDILISNELFSNNSKTNKGDKGDGILDVFDRYNFTVKEDEPLEKEVAIDPELLGKAYEKFNAIRPDNFDEFQKALKSGKKGDESKFNKQFGVYYTPREIVHYMCQQSLINYLFSQFNGGMVTYEKPGDRQTDLLGNTSKKGQLDLTIEHKERPAIPKEDIETLIHYGERLSENEEMALIKQQKINEGQQKTSDYKLKLSESIRDNAKKIDEKLSSIKVCDPAIGSGAFPVGMMSEIVRARNTLSTFIKNTNRSIYHFKRDCIENSLYGVDIDSGAVEIAKLRLWLSLVVDEEDIRQIKPLPNLDYKIVCGNSLLGLPADILFDDAISKEIEEKKKQYFNTTNPSEKNKIRTTINNLFLQLMENIKKYDPTVADINFDFHTHFSEVFHEKGGFDVVVANPPYVPGKQLESSLKQRLRCSYKFIGGKYDLYIVFLEKGINIMRSDGCLSFIIPNAFLVNENAAIIRKSIIENALLSSIALYDKKIFDATVESIVLFIHQNNNRALAIIGPGERRTRLNYDLLLHDKFCRLIVQQNENTASILNKISSNSKPLGLLSDICIGIQVGGDGDSSEFKARYISKIRLNLSYKPMLDGKDYLPFKTNWDGKYIKYGQWLHRKRDEKYFNNDKIMIRQVGAVPVASIDYDKFYTLNTIYNVLLTDPNYPIEYVFALINSTVVKFYWQCKLGDSKAFFPKIKKSQLVEIPLRLNPNTYMDEIVEITKGIFAHRKLDISFDTSIFEARLDAVVAHLYELTVEEYNLIMMDLKIAEDTLDACLCEYEKFVDRQHRSAS
jgi:hypothetical protein